MNEVNVEFFPVWRKYPALFNRARLTKEQRGELLDAMMAYQFDGVEPEEFDIPLQVIWAVVQQDLDFARKRYENSVRNGKKGGRPKKEQPKETQQNPEKGNTISNTITESESITESISNTETESSAQVSVPKKVYGKYGWVLLSDQEYSELEKEMGTEQLQQCITYIDESAESTGNRNHWLKWHAVLRRCYQKKWHEASRSYAKEEIPKGASGDLGEAELEAIQRVLAT